MSKRSSLEQYKLKRLLEELKQKRGRGTELISLYIPAGRPISDVLSTLRQEYSTATNIKDRTTRHHVLEALTSVIQRLKLFKQTPPNGLVIFCGYVSTGVPGAEKMEVHVLEPPEKLNVYLYRCDSRFHVEILEEMISEKDVYGLMVVDRGGAAYALLKGKRIEVVKEITSGVPGKHRAGGQSSRRFERIIEQLAHEFLKRAGEYAKRIFLEEKNLKGIIIGGPGPTKYEFTEGDYLDYRLKEKIIAVLDVGNSGEEGIYELAKRAEDVLKDLEFTKEKRIVQKFLYHIARDTGLATYGEEYVRKALLMGAVDTLLISEKLEGYRIKAKCPSCGTQYEKTIRNETSELICPKCKSPLTIVFKGKTIDDLIDIAEKTGTRVEIISVDTEEGEILKNSFGGVAAILRFKISQ
ncbi:MAG: peptide chain release factor 1 [Thermoprotei archaeon]|nr:MAG: peptide chain release factor 1 [Thermoprotei archaeon]RLE98465.1 MAG: peptide chain release factor 1 [Thermoprotei archaeon]